MATPIDLRAARQQVLLCTEPSREQESVPLSEALGRRLGEAVCTDGPWPASDRSAMDGFAVVAGAAGLAAATELRVVGESLAGKPFAGTLTAGDAIRIMTGAVVPDGADAVVPVEQTSGYASEQVTLTEAVSAEANIRRMGSERRAGAEVLTAGAAIGPAEIGALAVLGCANVSVVRRPIVAIVATGDEVVPLDTVPGPHQVRESNSWALAAQIERAGGQPLRLGIAPDEPVGLRSMLERALGEADVVLTIGGISKGTHDLVHGTLSELGVQTEFHGIRLKPGKPTYFGRRSNDAERGARYVFGLPGNPMSTFTVFDLLVRPMLTRWLGGDAGEWGTQVALAAATRWKPNWREQAVPARFVRDAAAAAATGALRVELAPPSPSGDPFSLLFGTGYALVPPEAKREDCRDIDIVGGSTGIELP
ncbi:MAG: gephyrin-like molybdotransferase Glp [Planctomycetota bacterium]